MRCPTLKQLPAPPPDRQGWPWTEESRQLPETMPDGRPWPKISIVTPNYNYALFIEETIRSILLQGYPDLEYIVVDDGSTDRSVEIIKAYEPWLSHWICQTNHGQSHALNKGFSYATGIVGNWINSDDDLCPNALKAVALAVPKEQDENYIIGGSGEYMDADGKVSRTVSTEIHRQGWPFSFSMSMRGSIQMSYFFSLNLFRESGGINPFLSYVMDTDLFYRFGRVGYKNIRIPDPIGRFRQHERSNTTGFPYRMTFEKLALFRWYCYLEPGSTREAMRHIAERFLHGDFEGAPWKARLRALAFVLRQSPRLLLQKKHLRGSLGLLWS